MTGVLLLIFCMLFCLCSIQFLSWKFVCLASIISLSRNFALFLFAFCVYGEIAAADVSERRGATSAKLTRYRGRRGATSAAAISPHTQTARKNNTRSIRVLIPRKHVSPIVSETKLGFLCLVRNILARPEIFGPKHKNPS